MMQSPPAREPESGFANYHGTIMKMEIGMNNIIWIVGAVVIVLAVLSFFGLR